MDLNEISEAAREHLLKLGFGASVFSLPEKAHKYENLEKFTGIPKKRLMYLARAGKIPFLNKAKPGCRIEFKILDAIEWAANQG